MNTEDRKQLLSLKWFERLGIGPPLIISCNIDTVGSQQTNFGDSLQECFQLHRGLSNVVIVSLKYILSFLTINNREAYWHFQVEVSWL
jgi:hypothetical protein